jgi:hypothetical protein
MLINTNPQYILQLANDQVGETITHACIKFSADKAKKFMLHPQFQKLSYIGKIYVAANYRGQVWFLLAEHINTKARELFHQIRCEVKGA